MNGFSFTVSFGFVGWYKDLSVKQRWSTDFLCSAFMHILYMGYTSFY